MESIELNVKKEQKEFIYQNLSKYVKLTQHKLMRLGKDR